MCDRPPAGERPAASRIPGSPPIGRLPEESAPARHALRVAALPSAMQCVDTASTGLLQAAADVRRLASGLAPAATSPTEAAVPPKATSMLKRHSAFVRVIASGSAAQRLCLTRPEARTAAIGGRKEGEG